MKKYVKIVLLILWMVVIFIFSHQTGKESTDASQFVLSFLEFLGIDLNSYFGKISEFIVRKAAHLFEYFILSLLIFSVLKDKLSFKYLYPILFSFLYACTDEFHQMFVPNRGPSFRDVLIDTTGASIGMLLIFFIKFINKTKKRQTKGAI